MASNLSIKEMIELCSISCQQYIGFLRRFADILRFHNHPGDIVVEMSLMEEISSVKQIFDFEEPKPSSSTSHKLKRDFENFESFLVPLSPGRIQRVLDLIEPIGHSKLGFHLVFPDNSKRFIQVEIKLAMYGNLKTIHIHESKYDSRNPN